MEGFDSGGSIEKAPKMEGLKQIDENSTGSFSVLIGIVSFIYFFCYGNFGKSGIGICYAGDAVFDASQYAFFGKDVVEEVELGGLEDEEDNIAASAFDEEEFLFDKEEV